MKYEPEELLKRIKEHVIKCAQIAWAAGNKSDARIYNEMLSLLGLHDKGEEMIRFPVYPGKLWVRYPAGSLKEIKVRVFEPSQPEKDFDSTLSWAEFKVEGFHDEVPEGASATPTYIKLMNRWTEVKNQVHRLERKNAHLEAQLSKAESEKGFAERERDALEERNKYLEAALKNAVHVTTARKDQVKKAEHKADNMAHRNVSLQDRVSILEAEIEKLKAEKAHEDQ